MHSTVVQDDGGKILCKNEVPVGETFHSQEGAQIEKRKAIDGDPLTTGGEKVPQISGLVCRPEESIVLVKETCTTGYYRKKTEEKAANKGGNATKKKDQLADGLRFNAVPEGQIPGDVHLKGTVEVDGDKEARSTAQVNEDPLGHAKVAHSYEAKCKEVADEGGKPVEGVPVR